MKQLTLPIGYSTKAFIRSSDATKLLEILERATIVKQEHVYDPREGQYGQFEASYYDSPDLEFCLPPSLIANTYDEALALCEEWKAGQLKLLPPPDEEGIED